MAVLDRFNAAIDVVEKAVISVGLGAATLLLFTNVVMRYAFHSGLPWVLEAVQYLFAWVVLVGAAHGVKVGIHLGIDILVEKLPHRMRRAVVLLAVALSLAFVASMFWLSIEYTWRIYQWGDLTEDLQIPQWLPYLGIPIGLGLMLYHMLTVAWMIWQGKLERIHASEASQALEELQR